MLDSRSAASDPGALAPARGIKLAAQSTPRRRRGGLAPGLPAAIAPHNAAAAVTGAAFS
jgi:hypothetical protein